MSKEADIVRAAEALKAIKALVESNQDDNIAPDADILTLDSVVWRSPSTPVIDPVAQNAALSPPSNPEQTIVALANAAEIFAQTPAPQSEQPQVESKVAPQPAHMESDPYSIFELGEPVLRDRLETEPPASQGLPPEQSEVMAVQAARQLQYEKIMQERARQKALAPSPHLQPTAPRPAPQDNAADGGNFADFTVDEHEAMMSTPLGRLDLTASSATEPSIDTAIEQAAIEQATIEPAQPTPTPEVQPEKVSPNAVEAPVDVHVEAPVEAPVEAMTTPAAQSAPSPANAAAKAQIPLHIVTDNGVEEGDESNPQDVMRNALRSMIREQIGTWVQDNIGSLIEDALREPPRERKNTPHRNNLNKD